MKPGDRMTLWGKEGYFISQKGATGGLVVFWWPDGLEPRRTVLLAQAHWDGLPKGMGFSGVMPCTS